MSRTPTPRASQLHTDSLFLEVESLPQSKLERVSAVGKRSIKDATNVFFHECNRFLVSEVRNQKVTPHLYDLFLTKRKR